MDKLFNASIFIFGCDHIVLRYVCEHRYTHSTLTTPSTRIHNFLRAVAVFNATITNDDITLGYQLIKTIQGFGLYVVC